MAGPTSARGGGTELENEVPEGPVDRWRPVDGRAGSLLTEGWHSLSQPLPGLRLDGTAIAVPFGTDLGRGSALDPPGALLRFQTEDEQTFAATVEPPPPGHEVGLAAYADPQHHYAALLRMGAAGLEIILRRTADDLTSEAIQPWPATGPVRIEITATPSSYRFAAEGGGLRVEIGRGSARLLSAEACELFVGAHSRPLRLRPAERKRYLHRYCDRLNAAPSKPLAGLNKVVRHFPWTLARPAEAYVERDTSALAGRPRAPRGRATTEGAKGGGIQSCHSSGQPCGRRP